MFLESLNVLYPAGLILTQFGFSLQQLELLYPGTLLLLSEQSLLPTGLQGLGFSIKITKYMKIIPFSMKVCL